MRPNNRVMFVDDEDGVRTSYDRYFTSHGFDVETAVNGASAVLHLRDDPVDVVVADLKMPVMDGIQLLQWIHDEQPDTRFILLTGYGNEEVEERARSLGAYEYLNKPINPDTLAAVVTGALHLPVEQEAPAVAEEEQAEEEEAADAEAVTVKGPARRTMEIVLGLLLAPLLGLAFVIFLPVIGFGALFWTLGQRIQDALKPAQS